MNELTDGIGTFSSARCRTDTVRRLCAVLALLAVGCSSALPNSTVRPSEAKKVEQTSAVPASSAGTEESEWAELAARPLRLPSVNVDSQCPVSNMRAIPGTAAGAGDGPIYAVGTTPLPIDPRGAKVLFTSAPEYKEPALIRGRRLDTSDVIRFTGSNDTRG
ncbi:MAG: hypothetical protein KGN00_12810, partial [Chloroflexota bacterium]|nr:hypothetical protein [Chloroflexota bacterium]